MDKGIAPQVVIGGREFAAPHFADTVVQGWRIIDGRVESTGHYDVREWTPAEVAGYYRRKAAHARFAKLPDRARSFLYQHAEPWHGFEWTDDDDEVVTTPAPRFYGIKHRIARAIIRAGRYELGAVTFQRVQVSNNYADGYTLTGLVGCQFVNNTADVRPVDVRDHGATGDGTTDDTAAIQAAITWPASRRH